MADAQTERAYQKQPTIFQNKKRVLVADGAKEGKEKLPRYHKSVGLGFKTPREAIDGTYIDKKCPFTGNVSIRGRILSGVVTKMKMQRTIVIRRDYLHYIRKYNRFEKRHKNLSVHLSPCFRDVTVGDIVTVGECRPLSKTVRFNVLKVTKAAGAKKPWSLLQRLYSKAPGPVNHLPWQNMGGGGSKPDLAADAHRGRPTRPASPTLRNPWRNISWGDKQEDLQYVKNYQPQSDTVSHIRVLLYGPVGAGKSSFINSVSSVLRGRMAHAALAGSNNAEQSFTKNYKTHKIKKEVKGNFYPFVFNDIMGLEEKTGQGVSVEDIKLALKGHVKDGYMFNPVSPLTPEDPDYNSSPTPDDRVHVLVWVCSANTPEVTPAVLQKMRDVRETASSMGVPQLVVVTKVDEACAETEKDLKNVYMSKHLKKKMSDISSVLGVPLNCIFPVKNYSEESALVDDVDSLILNALRMMIDFGDDFIETM